MSLVVEPHEHGVVRVFALNTPPEEIDFRAALRADELDGSFVEVIDVGDLAEIGLSGYLIEGLGLDADRVARDRARLDAVRGQVALIPSHAFGGAGQTLRPGPALSHLGTYAEEADTRPVINLEAESARGLADGGAAPPRAAVRGRPTRRGVIPAVILTTLLVLLAVAFLLSQGSGR